MFRVVTLTPTTPGSSSSALGSAAGGPGPVPPGGSWYLLWVTAGSLAAGASGRRLSSLRVPPTPFMEGADPLVAAPTYGGQPASWDPVSEPTLGLRVCGYHTQCGTCQNPPSNVSTAVLVWVTITAGVALQRVREGERGRAER